MSRTAQTVTGIARAALDRWTSRRARNSLLWPLCSGMSPAYLRTKLTQPLPTRDRGVLRTVLDARAYMLALPKTRKTRQHWQRACRLLLEQADVDALTRQIHLVLFFDGKLDLAAMEVA